MTQTTAGTAGMIIAGVFASASSLPRVMYGHPARGARVDAGDTPTDAVVPQFAHDFVRGGFGGYSGCLCELVLPNANDCARASK